MSASGRKQMLGNVRFRPEADTQLRRPREAHVRKRSVVLDAVVRGHSRSLAGRAALSQR